MVDFASVNPLRNVGVGSIGMFVLIVVIAVLIILMAGGGIWLYFYRKKLKYTIPLQKKIGNNVMKVAKYKAMDFGLGHSGDKLWYVPKAKKYISPATIQTAPNEYTHFEREDGEWINVGYPDVDLKMKEMGVKYVQQDMRAQRIAIGDMLEQRFKEKKSFWDKWGHLITEMVFFLILAVAMGIIFYMWGGLIDKTDKIMARVIQYEEEQRKSGNAGVVPAFIFLIGYNIRRFKSKW